MTKSFAFAIISEVLIKIGKVSNMKKEKDIFDKIMNTRLMNFFQPFYIKNKEILLYLFFGGLTFIVSICSYACFEYGVGLNPLIANLFSWVLAVLFAYITNRIWVFETVASKLKEIFREILSFFGGRIATLVLEELILYVGIELLDINSILVKVIGQIVVIILNYFISKFYVFSTK